MSALDWPALMRAGLQGLGLRPAEFWALTPAELRVMLGERPGAASLGRDGLEALIRAYPDSQERAEDV
ncbi:rcc01693 family protein [Primorskyibacter marinus]|uniref:rcc01693 family protein n=1 Tax=Primorskyibacter marinus TaxID=1977320 RepID=UPI000E304095|nr:rcc01693 family protein [Primorskyibacter marinus]